MAGNDSAVAEEAARQDPALTGRPNVSCLSLDKYLSEITGDVTGSANVRFIFVLLYALVFVLGITGNSFVVVAVTRNRALQTVRNFFLVNLSASDMVVCLTSLPITPYTIMLKNWTFGEPLCYAIPMVQGMSVIISALTLTAIAIDRFILIVHPTAKPIQKQHALAMIASTWILAASLALPMVVNYELVPGTNYETDGVPLCGHFCEEIGWSAQHRMIYGMTVLILQFVVPVCIISFCYIKISQSLRQNLLRRRLGYSTSNSICSSSSSKRHRSASKRRARTNRMLILMVCLFAAVWFPQVLLNVLRDFDALPEALNQQPYLLALMVHLFAMTSTVWNPILYGGLNESFRDAFMNLLPCVDWDKLAKRKRKREIVATSVCLPSGTTVSISRPEKSTRENSFSSFFSGRKSPLMDGSSWRDIHSPDSIAISPTTRLSPCSFGTINVTGEN